MKLSIFGLNILPLRVHCICFELENWINWQLIFSTLTINTKNNNSVNYNFHIINFHMFSPNSSHCLWNMFVMFWFSMLSNQWLYWIIYDYCFLIFVTIMQTTKNISKLSGNLINAEKLSSTLFQHNLFECFFFCFMQPKCFREMTATFPRKLFLQTF